MNKRGLILNLFKAFLILCFALPISANGQAEKESDPGIIELNMFGYQFGGTNVVYRDIIDLYMAKHPNVKINVEEYPWDAYFRNLEVRFNADDPNIDLVIIDTPMMASYAARGFLEDLTNYVPEDEFKTTLTQAALDSVTFNDAIMASPMQTSDQYLYINLDYAEEAGVELPFVVDADTRITADIAEKWNNNGWTWKEALDAAQKMTKDTDGDGITDVYGLHFEQTARIYQLQPLGGSRGGKVVSPDGTSVVGYFDQAPWLKAVEFYGDLFNKYKVEDPGAFAPGYDAKSEFVNGKYGMMIGGGWVLKRILAAENDMRVAIAAHPYFEDGKRTTPTGSWSLAMASSADEEVKAVAADFIKFWTLSQEGNMLWYDIRGELPATYYMLNEIETNDKYADFPISAQRLGAYQVVNTAQSRPVTPYYSFVSAGFDQAFRDAAQGVDPEKALQEAVETIDKEIKRVQ